jgi:hypothetical protein
MVCSKCGNRGDAGERFCRKCGAGPANGLDGTVKENPLRNGGGANLFAAPSKDPDELTGNGIGAFIMGDGFLIVAVILSVTDTSISSLLWLLLLIPAFFFYGKGLADILHARQIYRRRKQTSLGGKPETADLPPSPASVIDVFRNYNSGELLSSPSVTARTTGRLK